jgi:hypothetical protein
MQNTFSQDISPTVWYSHPIFTSGYTYHGRVMGHATGGDSTEYFGRLTRDLLRDRLTLGLDFSYRWRGKLLLSSFGFPTRERHYEGGLDLQYFFTNAWEFFGRFAIERVDNANLQPGEDHTNLLFFFQARYHFF